MSNRVRSGPRTSAEALLMVINDILDFSKIEAGKLELEDVPFSLSANIDEALDLVAAPAAAKGIELYQDISRTAPGIVIADPGRLRQILVNLLSNAVKFTKEGEVVVRIENGEDDANGRSLHISVRDTGVGIPQDRMHKLFASFSQVDASTTRKYGGTGLGLAICKRLAEAMGGRVWAESEEGKGSTFHVEIRTKASTDPGIEPPDDLKTRLKGKRALVVEDNPGLLGIMRRTLSDWGLEVQAAERAEHAIAAVVSSPVFDLLLIDTTLSGMPGLLLTHEIRKLSRGKTPSIVLTAPLGWRETDEGISPAELERLHVMATLSKPVKRSMLLESLATLTGLVPVSEPSSPPRQEDLLGSRHPLRILIAEDNPINQKVTVRMLERLGYTADVVSDGIEVLDALKRKRFDVVLMDVQMPQLDGIEATKRILTTVLPNRRPTIVAMTANAFSEDRSICLAAGMTEFLPKPVQPTQLQAILERCPSIVRGSTMSQDQVVAPIDSTNWQRLGQIAGEVSDSLADELAQLFIETATEQVEGIKRAVAERDAKGCKFNAHKLKGSAAIIGAPTLKALCAQLEARADRDTWEASDGLSADIALEVQRVMSALKTKMSVPPPPL
ncbi:MAG: response regulator [Polyangiaceae bacterium]